MNEFNFTVDICTRMQNSDVQVTCKRTDVWIEKASSELHETYEIRKQKLRSIHELVNEKYGTSFNDEFLIRFLRAKKFNTLTALEMVSIITFYIS